MQVQVLSFPLFRFGNWNYGFGIEINPKSKITNPKFKWLRSSMDLERLSSNQKAAGSSPAEAFRFGIWEWGLRIGKHKSKTQNPKSKIATGA